jgi:hypothetical protein
MQATERKQFDFRKVWQFEAMYHQDWLKKIKRITKARHIIFTRYQDTYQIVSHFDNEEGGTDRITYQLEKSPSDLRDVDYQHLMEGLKNRKENEQLS